MNITKAVLHTSNIGEMKLFYIQTLGFEIVSETEASFSVRVGSSILEFERDFLNIPKQYHFAFNIPGNLFPEAKDWIKARTPLLTHDNEDEIFFESSNAHSLYFYDPDENVVELIARHAVNPHKSVQFFTAQDMLNIAEMSLTTDEVLYVGEKLEEIGVFQRHRLALKESMLNFLGEPQDGTHILLGPAGRNWLFSTKDAIVSPIAIEINDKNRIRIDVNGTLHLELLQRRAT